MSFPKKRWEIIGVIVLFAIIVFLSIYKLTESPPIWVDEGMIIQTSKNLVERAMYSFQVGPHTMISPGFISTSYPVTFPIAVSFFLFGVGLLQARIVMVFFILFLVAIIFYFIRKLSANSFISIAALALIATFPPLYGNGKNVLGEIPGLFYLSFFLLFILLIEKKEKIISFSWPIAGIFLGLALATKPIFILLIPTVFVVGLYSYCKEMEVFGQNSIRNILLFGLFSCIPVVLFLLIQFSGDTIGGTLAYYANPYKVDILRAIFVNLMRFKSEAQPFYFLALFSVWTASIVLRFIQHKKVFLAELIVFLFSILVFCAYFRTPGFYRYFFLAQFFAIAFFPLALSSIFSGYKHRTVIIISSVLVLLALQSYQLLFSSWVSDYYKSHRTAESSDVISSIPATDSVMFYQAPELVLFFKGFDYYQYLDTIENETTKKEKDMVVSGGLTNDVVVSSDVFQKNLTLFSSYPKKIVFDRYMLLKKK